MTDVGAPLIPPYAAAPQPRRALGTTAFVLSLIAFVGDFVVLIVIIASAIAALGTFVQFLEGNDSDFAGAATALIAAVVVGFGGTFLALVGVILGIVAAARNRGRVLGVVGIVLGALVLISRIVLAIGIATGGSGAGN